MPTLRESIGNFLLGDSIEKIRAESKRQGYVEARDEESGYVPLKVFDEAYRESYRYSREQDKGWKPISKTSGDKDLSPTEYDDLHKAVYMLYTTNPMAKGLVDLTTNFIVGESLNVVADDDDVQGVIDTFWNDERNNMDFRSERLLSETILFGEQFIAFFPNFENGTVQVTQIDPIKVESIATDIDNAEKEVLVILKKSEAKDRQNKAYICWDTIPDNGKGKIAGLAGGMKLEDLKEFLPDKFNIGDTVKTADDFNIQEDVFVIHYKINSVTGSTRGWSDLATNVNWIAIFDEGLLNTMRLRRFRTAFIYDVTLQNAGKPEIEAKKKEIADNPPRPGSVMVHNDKETWQTQQPNIDSKDTAEDLHQVLMHAGRALNIPEHYMGSGGDVNRASASEMGLPTIKYMKRRQKFFKALLNQIIKIAIGVNVESSAGKLIKADNKFTIEFPDIDTKDNLAIAQAVNSLVMALVAAKDSGWISDKTAQKLMFKYLGEENTPAEEEEIIKQEKGDAKSKTEVTKDYQDIDIKEAVGIE